MKSSSRTRAEISAALRQQIIESAFRVYSEKTIDAINLTQVAKAAGVGVATVYRYFESKTELVLEVNTWVWDKYMNEKQVRNDADERSAAEIFEVYLESFIDLYRDHRDILRFNQFFNVYIQREDVTAEQLTPFNRMVDSLARRFHHLYEKARVDHTMRTDIPERELFSKTLHLMLAAVTRYAVGLAYDGGIPPEEELRYLKELLLRDNISMTHRRVHPCSKESQRSGGC